ncbi:MAG: polymerase sigma-70 factor, subfamily [Actinomycetota bacterium]|jgi:RNA polymerase sigma-70 factor (ECF subfamily)|nr:polymerase sigma-70 factor, subfamily [Actinomycetota bacterium]
MSSMLELPPVLAEPSAAPAPAREPHLRLVAPAPLDFDEAARNITPRLQRYATRRLGDAHEAEELVQEALLRAYKHAEQLHTEDDLIAWCTVVTGRLVIDRLRVRGRSTSVAEVPEGTRVGRDTAEVVVARDEARMALDALDAMPSRQAAVLWAREVEGQGYDEIGRRFGMTEPAVRSILTRARKALRKEYAARGGTLPVAGLAALAPWVAGLRWADRLRSAATKLAAPAVIGAMALGLVGGALHSPYSGGGKAPATAQAVGSQHVSANGLDRPNPALIRAGSAHQTAVSAPASTTSHSTVNKDNVLRTTHVTTVCTPTDHWTIGASGGSDCTTGDKGSTVFVPQRLPDNPTGWNYLGVETPVECTDVPSTPVTACQPSTQNPGAQS